MEKSRLNFIKFKPEISEIGKKKKINKNFDVLLKRNIKGGKELLAHPVRSEWKHSQLLGLNFRSNTS